MAVREIVGTVERPGNIPIVGAVVSASVYSGVDGQVVYSAGDACVGRTATLTGPSGGWSLTLTPNSLISPPGTVYAISVAMPDGPSSTYWVDVPDTAGPHNVSEILAEQPGALPTQALSDHAAAASAHGVSGDIVGTAGTQTLEAKSLDAPTLVMGAPGDLQRRHLVDLREYGTLQDAVDAAAGGTLLIPDGTHDVSTTLEYDADANGPLRILGVGPGSVLRAVGSCAKILHIHALAGRARQFITLESFAVSSNTTSCIEGIHLYGIADYQLHDVVVRGGSKMATGIRLTGTQQGELSGGFIDGCGTGVKLDKSNDDGAGIVASNGCDMHGVSFAVTGTGVSVDGADDLFMHGNHLTGSTVGVDVLSAGYGQLVIEANHFELHATGVKVAGAQTAIRNNGFACTTDVDMVSGNGSVIDGNLFNGTVELRNTVSDLVFSNNWLGGTVNDSSVRITKHGNRHFAGSGLLGASLRDSLTVTARETTAGDALTVRPNAAISGSWGVSVYGAGSGDIYVRCGDVAIAGDTGGSKLKVLSAVGGSEWARFDWNGLSLLASSVVRTGRGTTANRPAASTVGAGAQWYDTTLGKPIWSNGTVWKDATGATV